jgi:hypothetical protein
MIEKASILQTYPRLALYSEERFRGAVRVFRGNLGIRDVDRRGRDAESLRFFSPNANATLVLFSEESFRGSFRVFRGSRNIANLDDIIFGEEPESIVMANFRLTLAQIRTIRRTGNLPSGFRRL